MKSGPGATVALSRVRGKEARQMRYHWLAALGMTALVACTSGGQQPTLTPLPTSTVQPTSTAQPTGTPQPTRPPQPTATPVPTPSGSGFVLTVLPAEDPVEARMAIPGEVVCFLVMVEGSSGEVELTVSAEGAEVSHIRPSARLQEGTVGEVCVTPAPAAVETTSSVAITASGDGLDVTQERTIGIMPWTDDRRLEAQPYLERWVAWLESAHPDYGITADTEWQSTFVQPVLIVSHYAYWSDEWEMVISWHVMIPPDDFSEIFLRRRFTESGYSAAFRMDSFAEDSVPRQIPARDLIR
jgi:hypothetical protein